jgi:hypothetical protein
MSMRLYRQCFVSLLLLLCVQSQGLAEDVEEVVIPDKDLNELRQDLYAAREATSKTAGRRAYKNAVRSAKSLLLKNRDAVNKYALLQLMFVGQQNLLMLDNSERNRSDFFATCDALVEAPDAYAKARLQAEVLLLRRKMSAPTVTDAQRLSAIAQLADKYRDTEAEAESLMISALYSIDLRDVHLVGAFVKELSTNFGQRPAVIKFLREKMGYSSDFRFHGNFESLDGEMMNFTEGRPYVALYWAKDMPNVKTRLAEIAEAQKRLPGQFDVYSFNVDGLADGGKKFLAGLGYDFKVMRVERRDLKLVNIMVVDDYGWSRGQVVGHTHNFRRTPLYSRVQHALGSLNISPILLSLRTAEFMAIATAPTQMTQAIHDAFIPAPRRYDLDAKQALEMYETVIAACEAALAAHKDDAQLWKVHNLRIVALMGQWRLTRKAQYLAKAVLSAGEVLKSQAASDDVLLARYCLAVQDLNDNETAAKDLIEKFKTDCGGDKATAKAHALAFLLAFASQSRPYYEEYRDLLLNKSHDDASVWTLSSHLLDPKASALLFERALSQVKKKDNRKKYEVVAEGTDSSRPFNADFIQDSFNRDGVNTVIFSEKCDDTTAVKLQEGMFNAAQSVSTTIGVFPVKDKAHFEALYKKHSWRSKAVFLEPAQWDEASRKWGVVATKKAPTAYVVKPDESILLSVSGLSSRMRGGNGSRDVEGAIRQYKLDLSDNSLFNGDYSTYIKEVNNSFPLENAPRPRYSTSYEDRVCKHRLKQIWTYVQMKDWKNALASANKNIDIHMKPPSNNYFKYCPGCSKQVNCLAIRLNCLKDLGKVEEAKKTEALLKAATCPPGNPTINDRPWRMPSDPAQRLAYMDNYMRMTVIQHGSSTVRKQTMVATLMLRAEIYDATGQPDSAAFDRERARAQSWPHPPKEYDARKSLLAAAHRRKVIRTEIDAKNWDRALELVNENVAHHEADAVRRKQHCADCAFHVVALKQRTQFLEKLGWDDANKTNDTMIAALACPAGTEEVAVAKFVHNYLYQRSEKGDIGKIKFISEYMAGGNYGPAGGAIPFQRRMSLAEDLILRLEIHEAMGEKEKAEHDRYRSLGLKFPYGLDVKVGEDKGPTRYVDLLEAGVQEIK